VGVEPIDMLCHTLKSKEEERISFLKSLPEILKRIKDRQR